ncbi:MAG: hypothetical protein IJZ51_09175 [Ruminiclostridium sp.]|nr:hypothetical protein [Ruminiclostridium sp.]
MPNIPQLTSPVSNNKSYSFTNRQYDGNIEPFDMVELAQPLKAAGASQEESGSAAAMMMGRKNLAPLTVQIKDPTMAVETLKNLLSSDILEQTMISGYTELYGDMEELIKSFYLSPEKLVEEIRNQEKQNTMFSGDEFYKLLHGILKTTTSPEIRDNIGNLLKALNFAGNKEEILNALSANLKFLSEYFSPNASLSAKLTKLSDQWGAEDAEFMFEPLKGETLALLKDVSASLLNDERTQTFIPLIIHNLSRYNTNKYMLKESFANLLTYIPSNEMRRELSTAFNNLLQKMFSPKQLSEMEDNSDTYNNTLIQKENQEFFSIFDNKDENSSLSLFIKTHMSSEEYLEGIDLSAEKLEFLTNPFFDGEQSGLQTIKNILMSMLGGTESRQMIPVIHKEIQGIADLTTLVEYLNNILKEMPDIDQREDVFRFFTEIVNKMAERKELPADSNIPSSPSTLDKLTEFIAKNINHEAIQSLDNFNASNLLQSLLNAPGVFTPLAHYVLPLQFEDTKAFGELWVDNDENNPNNTPIGQKNYHLFLTFDIESVGRFEVDMYALGENISLSFLYPEGFDYRVKRLTDKIDLVIRNIGYKPVKMETAVLRKPHNLTEVFPKIVDRRKGLNVQA